MDLSSHVFSSFVGFLTGPSNRRNLRLRGWIKAFIVFSVLSEIAICQTPPESEQALQLHYQDQHVVMDNGILQVTLSNPEGFVTGIQYHGISNVLAYNGSEHDRGYWDLVWNFPGKTTKVTKGTVDRIEATKLEVIVQNDEQIELSFTRTWNSSLDKAVPVNIDKRFVMLRNSSGFYTYAIFERLEGWPAVEVDNIRIAFKLNEDKFHYMAISDERQRYMPLPEDRVPPRGQALAYPEAVLLIDPREPEFKGEVDDKYAYSMESKDLKVHGWISTNDSVGFWQITPSNEFRSAGPLKQFLNSHVGPTHLTIFHSTHYVGKELIISFEEGEAWKKVFGPVFVYLNSFPQGVDPLLLWNEAKNQTRIEEQMWPYEFPTSGDFPGSDRRGSVTGRFLISDRYISSEYISGNGSYVGLAAPGDVGSWQKECKGYQFWTKVDENGHFLIKNVRSGKYNIYGWASGFIGDYHNDTVIDIASGSNIDIGELIYEPPRDGPTIWEIGVPDRTAAEFYIPNPDPRYTNKLYMDHDRFRQYGLWERYTELYPDQDLVFDVDADDYTKDWFFMQVTRKVGEGGYNGTTWQIKFKLDKVVNETSSSYKLRIALATANVAELQVRVNDPKTPLLFTTGEMIRFETRIEEQMWPYEFPTSGDFPGSDRRGSVTGRFLISDRNGIHGVYWLNSVDVPSSSLLRGNNTIFLTQPLAVSPFQGLMYDYIRLESPDPLYHITIS
ncbi:PREDICTED: probable rhamnogalacturonate lyase B [Tarenaya hassleriana]|uniref:probable rhamnogalacturonate lyase B n=1 Tax=Tarenaya hassleriana TaxID=28532 RepID=UPI0008FD7F58|nr:PREDICTED: probable rhamnogalacturonate lyase B [Tarenaya hassleriana]